MYSRVQLDDGRRRTMTKEERQGNEELPRGGRAFANDNTRSSGFTPSCFYPVEVYGFRYPPQHYSWKTHQDGMERLKKAHRLAPTVSLPYYVRFYDDFPVREVESHWPDTRGDMDKTFVVQTSSKVIERCILMTTDPGDLVLDPTCGSGTTAYVAEQWGRRWITVDTSRVALALARARIMGARYPYYLLSDSRDGQVKRAEVERRAASESPTYGDIRQGFVYERVPHITLRDIANNAEIDVIWEDARKDLEPLREELNRVIGESWEEWEIPRDAEETWPDRSKEPSRPVVGAAHRPAEEDRRLHRRQCRLRVPLRQAIRGPQQGARRGAVHGREHLAPPCPGSRRARGDDRRVGQRLRERVRLRPGHPRQPEDLRRPTGAQGGQDRVLVHYPVAGAAGLRGGALRGGRRGGRHRAPGGDLRRPGVRHGVPSGPGGGGARGRGRRVRRADRLRLQLRGAHHRVREPGARSGAEGADERRPAHGGRPEEHGQGQPLRDIRRAGYFSGQWSVAGCRQWEDGCEL